MSSKHSECKRGFYHTGGAYYGKIVLAGSRDIDRVTVGFYHPGGGTTGEFTFVWQMLGSSVSTRLEVWDDAWSALHLFGDVLAMLAKHDGKHLTPIEFCELLMSCGIEDMTARVGPAPIERCPNTGDMFEQEGDDGTSEAN